MEKNKEIVRDHWIYIGERQFHKARTLMANNVVVKEPNTREKYVGVDNYVRFNEKYPGNWKVSIEKLISHDENMVISVVKLEDVDQQMSFYATSFVTLQDNLITEMENYWGDNGEPPAWRIEQSLSERY